VAAELDHVLAAWQWATEAVDAALLARLAGPLQFHERHSGHWHTCIERFERAAAALRARMPADASTPRDAVEVQALARVLAGLADLRFAIGALDATAADAKACVELAPLLSDDAPVADAFMTLNSVCWQRDQFDEAMVWVDRYLESAARSGQRLREAHGLTSRSLLFKELGRYDEALRDSHAARTLLHALGETAQLPTVLNNEGNLLRVMKRHDEAVEALREGLHWTHQHRMVRDRPWLLTNLAIALEDRACHDEAESTLREALADLEVNAEPFLHVFALLTLGRVRAARERRAEGAMQPVWQALAMVDRVGFTWLRHDVVITAARIHRHAGEPRRAAALLQWVLGDADATAPCRQAARLRLDELGLDAATLADAARELPPETPIESVLARLPGRYASAARAGARADATA
jgi:tetratricopeptide (TPR) repeat protein